jgi:hypothetical protein
MFIVLIPVVWSNPQMEHTNFEMQYYEISISYTFLPLSQIENNVTIVSILTLDK